MRPSASRTLASSSTKRMRCFTTLFPLERQADDKRRAFAKLGLEGERPAMLLHNDRMSDSQTLSGSFADGFGREERVKDFSTNGFRDPCACIADSNLNPVSQSAGADRDRPLVC